MPLKTYRRRPELRCTSPSACPDFRRVVAPRRAAYGAPMARDAARKLVTADAKHHFAFAQRALLAQDEAQRDAALGEGFARFGMGFGHSLNQLAEIDPGRYQALHLQSARFVLRWIDGERFTGRADDHELRVAVGEEMLLMAQGHPRIGGVVARAILSLPPSHPKRDVPRAEALVRWRLAAAVDDDDASSFVSSVAPSAPPPWSSARPRRDQTPEVNSWGAPRTRPAEEYARSYSHRAGRLDSRTLPGRCSNRLLSPPVIAGEAGSQVSRH